MVNECDGDSSPTTRFPGLHKSELEKQTKNARVRGHQGDAQHESLRIRFCSDCCFAPPRPSVKPNQKFAIESSGTWTMVSAEDIMKDGTTRPYPAYGSHGKGYLCTERDGYMCLPLPIHFGCEARSSKSMGFQFLNAEDLNLSVPPTTAHSRIPMSDRRIDEKEIVHRPLDPG